MTLLGCNDTYVGSNNAAAHFQHTYTHTFCGYTHLKMTHTQILFMHQRCCINLAVDSVFKQKSKAIQKTSIQTHTNTYKNTDVQKPCLEPISRHLGYTFTFAVKVYILFVWKKNHMILAVKCYKNCDPTSTHRSTIYQFIMQLISNFHSKW